MALNGYYVGRGAVYVFADQYIIDELPQMGNVVPAAEVVQEDGETAIIYLDARQMDLATDLLEKRWALKRYVLHPDGNALVPRDVEPEEIRMPPAN